MLTCFQFLIFTPFIPFVSVESLRLVRVGILVFKTMFLKNVISKGSITFSLHILRNGLNFSATKVSRL